MVDAKKYIIISAKQNTMKCRIIYVQLENPNLKIQKNDVVNELIETVI